MAPAFQDGMFRTVTQEFDCLWTSADSQRGAF
jgi:hypothetical protein